MTTEKPISFEFLAPKHEYAMGLGWCRKVKVGEAEYVVGVERGRSVRIARMPRGKNRGYHWRGFVRTAQGRDLWAGQVDKSASVRRLLTCAGIVAEKTP